MKDGGKTHGAGLFGGTILLTRIISDEWLQRYLQSIEHYKETARKMKVNIEIQHHPLYDGMRETPNPFIVGPNNYAKFLDVQWECMNAAVARRAE